jgi:uncharacterized protein with HEPN domain
MPPPDEAWLRDLVEAAQKAIAFCQGRTREDLNSDEMLRLALTKLVEIVGEAAKLISEPTRQLYPSVRGGPPPGCGRRLFITAVTAEL